jgi:EAL domain-containing protein (putative c-di-GMP-specific phosphodiesterase class I)
MGGKEIVLTASVGIAIYDGPDENPAELLYEAEIAMYRAKRSGADRVEIFNAEMRSDTNGRVAMEGELRAAIDRKQLRVVYQPIFYLPTESLAGFEAELRWEHPRLGTLNPTHFVPVAEESDLIAKLGSYVVTRAAREVQRWQRELPRPDQPLFVSLNVASRQLFRPELVNEVRHILGRAVMPKGSLRLEIGESLVMENPERARAVLEQLAAAGAGLALDEFGTGYSSLSYLNQLAFDTIKVDRAFVHARGQNGSGGVMLRSIVALAKELGRKVGAEGVEGEEDIAFLRSIGCEYAQGVYYGELMTDREVSQFLKVVRRAERRQRRSARLFRQGSKPRAEPTPAPAPGPAAVPATAPARTGPAPQPHPPNARQPPPGAPVPLRPVPPAGPALAPPPPGAPSGPPPQALPGRAALGANRTLLGPPPPLTPPGLPAGAGRMAPQRPGPAAPPSQSATAAARANMAPAPMRPAPPPAGLAAAAAPRRRPSAAPVAAAPAPQPVLPPRMQNAPLAPPAAPAPAASSAPPAGAPARPQRPPAARPAAVPAPAPPRAAPNPVPAPPSPQPPRPARPAPDLTKLPPAIRDSLAKLAGDPATEGEKPAGPAQTPDTAAGGDR